MWLGWREAAEDYAPFDVNVTTSQAVYDATPVVNRVQLIATTTNYFYPGAGGVAYVGVFHYITDYYKTGWVWNKGEGTLGMTISHESGHQVGLHHDGTSSVEYYGGHGNWGPIMGAPFYKPYVQWSMGEYPDANNSEDDLDIIATVLDTVADDAGDTDATATAVLQPVVNGEGVLAPAGLGTDIDVYRLKIPGTFRGTVLPLLGDEGQLRAANLAMDVTLRDSTGTVVAAMHSDDHTPLLPITNRFAYESTSLPAGDYYLSIEANCPDPDWSTGFGEYGNGGKYRMDLCWIPTVTLPDNLWQQYSLPGTPPPGSNTVAAIFGDDIAGVYGQDWILFTYDEQNERYHALGLNDTLQMGQGFWILQRTDTPVTIDMPSGTEFSTPATGQGCIAEGGCHLVTAPADPGTMQWGMLGFPSAYPTSVDTLRVTTDSSGPVDDCADSDGCTLEEARGVSVFHDQFWLYVGGETGYKAMDSGDSLSPWQGFWAAGLENAVSGATTLVVPENGCPEISSSDG